MSKLLISNHRELCWQSDFPCTANIYQAGSWPEHAAQKGDLEDLSIKFSQAQNVPSFCMTLHTGLRFLMETGWKLFTTMQDLHPFTPGQQTKSDPLLLQMQFLLRDGGGRMGGSRRGKEGTGGE